MAPSRAPRASFTGWPAALTLLAVCTAASAGPAAAPPTQPEPYLRVDRSDDRIIQLEVASRRFLPGDGDGPDVWLTGVVHIGEAGYFRELQDHLERRQKVLYEAVGRPGFVDPVPESGSPRRRTEEAIRFLAVRLEQHRREQGAYPGSLEALREHVARRSGLEAAWVRAAMMDGWGRELLYRPDTASFELRSREPDDRGFGARRSLRFADQPPLEEPELERPEGLQASLARGLGLVFQLEALDYDRPHFRNSDLTLSQLQALLVGRPAAAPAPPPDRGGATAGEPVKGAEDDVAEQEGSGHAAPSSAPAELERMVRLLDGTSLAARALGLVARIVEASPRLQEMAKGMLIEMLGEIDGDMAALAGVDGDMEKLMEILIDRRNELVVEELRELLEAAPAPGSIAVFYGAGHMADLERRLHEMGYRPDVDRWFVAMRADLERAGLSAAAWGQLRLMVRAQLRQLNLARLPVGR